jgi:hypothetical protein
MCIGVVWLDQQGLSVIRQDLLHVASLPMRPSEVVVGAGRAGFALRLPPCRRNSGSFLNADRYPLGPGHSHSPARIRGPSTPDVRPVATSRTRCTDPAAGIPRAEIGGLTSRRLARERIPERTSKNFVRWRPDYSVHCAGCPLFLDSSNEEGWSRRHSRALRCVNLRANSGQHRSSQARLEVGEL